MRKTYSNTAHPTLVKWIADISYAMYKESRKGRFRSLFIHDTGIKFMEIHTRRTNADAIVAQLLEANPAIEIRHANYI